MNYLNDLIKLICIVITFLKNHIPKIELGMYCIHVQIYKYRITQKKNWYIHLSPNLLDRRYLLNSEEVPVVKA